MTRSWPKVKLGEVLGQRKEFIRIDDLATYKRCRVQLNAQGIVLRDEVLGNEVKTKTQQVCRAGEFLVAEIDAKVGGYGILPPELDGAIVSGHYFLFEVHDTRLDQRFLGYFAKTPGFAKQVRAQGSTNYAAIRPSHVLAYEIPLPPLEEQRRMVAKLDALSAKLSEGNRLHQQAAEAAEALLTAWLESAVSSLTRRFGRVPVGRLITTAGYGTSERCAAERTEGAIPVLRIPNIASERIDLGDLKYAVLSNRDCQRLALAEGDIVVVRTNGSLDLVGRSAVIMGLAEPTVFASYLIKLRFDSATVLPHFAQCMLRNLRVSGELIGLARTTAGQYNVSLGRLRSAEIPLPPTSEQRRILEGLDALHAKVDEVKRPQAETGAELEALMPAILDRAFRGEL